MKRKPKPFKNPELEKLSQATRESEETFLEQVIAERGRVYGDPYISHRAIGLAFSGLIEHHYGIMLDHPIPASLVARLLLALKNQRASLVYHADNFVDAKAYLRFSEEFQQREAKQ
jgi:hypothetical protein